jgi:tetratricopeptide (TPR) repeat protein
MSRPIRSTRTPDEPTESFEDRLAVLFEELDLAIRFQRPSILLVFYDSEYVRADVERGLQNQLAGLGQQMVQLTVDEEQFDIPLLLSRRPDRERSVYSISGLSWGGGKEGANAYRALNMRREFFVDYSIRAVLWLNKTEAVDLPQHAPDFWAFRHRVVEFDEETVPVGPGSPSNILTTFPHAPATRPEDLHDQIRAGLARLSGLPDRPEAIGMRLDLLCDLAGLYQQDREYFQAVKHLKTGKRLARPLADGKLTARLSTQLGSVYLDLNDPGRAVRAFRKALRADPETETAWVGLGRAYLTEGRWKAAASAFTKAIDPPGSAPEAWTGLGWARRGLGQVDAALEAFHRAATLAPQSIQAWNNLGELYFDLGLLPQARQSCLKAAALTPDQARTWNNLGRISRMERRFSDAIIAHQHAVALDPHDPTARLGLIACYRLIGEDKLAEEQIELARTLMAKTSEYHQAIFASVCGNVPEAVDRLSAALTNKQVGPEAVRREPDFDFIRSDPRFLQFMETSNQDG